MKRGKINLDDATRNLNNLRVALKDVKLSREKVLEYLSEALGLKPSSVPKILPRLVEYSILQEYREGIHKFWKMGDLAQYHKDRVSNALNGKSRIPKTSAIEAAIKLLKSEGYKVERRSRLNTEKMKALLGDRLIECYDYEEV